MANDSTIETRLAGDLPAPAPAETTAVRPARHPAVARSRTCGALRGVARITIFFLLAGLSLAVMQWLVNSGLRRITTSYFGVSNRIMNGQVNADVLITGSSRAMVHYDPRIIAAATGLTAYNIGLNGSQTDMQLALLKAYLHHNKAPRLLIHNLDLFSFQTTHGGVYDPGQYLPYLREPAIYGALKRIEPEVWKSRYLPLYGYAVEDMRFTWITGLKGLLGVYPAEDRYLGFVPRHAAWTGEFDEFKHANAQGVQFAIEPQGVADVKELIELCQRRGTTVVLVYSPEFKGMQELEKNRAEIFAEFESLAQHYDVALWDYSDSRLSLNQELFYNSQHMNATGAGEFSREIAARLVSEKIPGAAVAASPPRSERP